MKKLLSLLLCAALLAGCLPMGALAAGTSGSGSPVTYYVSIEGNGSNSGTSEDAPLPSLRAVPWTDLGPGDQVLLKRGDTFTGYIQLQDLHGTADAPIVIGAYGDAAAGKPVIHAQGGGIWFQNYGSALSDTSQKWQGYVSSAILLYDCDYVTVEDVEVTNQVLDEAQWFQSGEDTEQGYGIMDRTGVAVVAKDAGASEGIALSGLSVHDVTGNGQDAKMANGGIVFTALAPEDAATTGAASFASAAVTDCDVTDVTQTGIGFFSYQDPAADAASTISGCTVSNAGGESIVAGGATVADSQAISSDHSLHAALFELSGDTLNVPTGTTVADLLAGVTTQESATVTVTKDGVTQSSGTEIVADMRMVITAQDASGSSAYTLALKNAYTHSTDWPGQQQGNVWFAQEKVSGAYADLTEWEVGSSWTCWKSSSSNNTSAVEYNKLTPDINASSTADSTSMAFRAPVAGNVTLSFNGTVYMANANNSGNTGTMTLSVTHNGTVKETATITNDGNAVSVSSVSVDVEQGDYLRVELSIDGTFTQAGVMIDPVVTYTSVTPVSPEQNVLDTQALQQAIADAYAAKEGVTVSDKAASEVAEGTRFVTQSEMDALDDAIEAGESVLAAANQETAASVLSASESSLLQTTTRPATASTFYVSTLSGSDSYDGLSEDTPFYSLSMINSMELLPGDKIYLERGSVWNGEVLHIRDQQGTAAAPIVIGAYGDETADKPTIHAKSEGIWYQNYRQGSDFDASGHVWRGYVSSSILLYDTEYIEVSGLAVTNWGKGGAAATETDYSAVVPGELDGLNPTAASNGVSANNKPYYNYGLKLDRTGVAVITQNIGTADHIYLQDLDVENVYGNVYDKHMANGGIYAIALYPLDNNTGVSRYDDLLIEGCYVKRVSRWGIGAGCSAYDGLNFGQSSTDNDISDETAQTYGSTNIVVRGNYLEAVGGDPLTVFDAYAPLVEYNTAYRCTLEINYTVYTEWAMGKRTHQGRVAAGIWPWKCKKALFRYNECYNMLGADSNGNGDGQAWDADSGDSTVYEYNYSSGNTGGVIMFCYTNSYNSVFRYNISYLDGTAGDGGPGIIDMTANPNGMIYNNTFILPANVRAHYRVSGQGLIENNIFATTGAAYDPNWNQNSYVTFRNNLYIGFSATPTNETAAVAANLSDVFTNTPVGPTAPLSTEKGAARTVNGVCVGWCHDRSAFDAFKLKEGSSAVNAGKTIDLSDGLASDHGVSEATADFFGAELDDTPDLGACDTATYAASSDCALKSCYFEVNETTKTLNVPSGTTVAALKAGITVHSAATKTVKSGNTEQTDDTAVAAGMTLAVTAEDGTTNTYTLALKDVYTHSTDWPGQQQGNVWFAQSKVDGEYANLTGWDTDWNCWSGDGYAAVETDKITPNIEINSANAATCVAFRAPVAGSVTLSFNGDVKLASTNSGNSGTVTLSITKNGVAQDEAHTIILDGSAVSIDPVTMDVAQGDLLRVEVTSMGTMKQAGVTVDPMVTYATGSAVAAAGGNVQDYAVAGPLEDPAANLSATEDAGVTQETVDDAVAALRSAIDTFTAAIQTGTKTDASNPSDDPSTPSDDPSTPSDDPSTPSNTSSTVKPSGNSGQTSSSGGYTQSDGNGSTTTTKVDVDGTVTKTTVAPDGTITTVTTQWDGKVTETVTTTTGRTVEKVTDASSDVTITVTEADGEVSAEIELPAVLPTLSQEERFADVPETYWADKEIHQIAALGLVRGVDTQQKIYNASASMTRSELTQVLYRLSGSVSGAAQSDFGDVAQDAWYADAVAWAAERGLVQGVGALTFSPQRQTTRAELCVILYRYANFLEMAPSADASALDAFPDSGEVSGWAKNGLSWCVAQGVLRGKSDAGEVTLDPNAAVTRAETAVILCRFIDLMK